MPKTYSPAGLGLGLNYVGTHAYGWNYNSAQGAGTFTALNFSTGKEYIVGQICCGIDNKAGAEHEFNVTINGNIVFSSKSDNGKETSLVNPFSSPVDILLPPNSEIKIDVIVNYTTPISVNLVGKVY